jgi:hypothetical protein
MGESPLLLLHIKNSGNQSLGEKNYSSIVLLCRKEQFLINLTKLTASQPLSNAKYVERAVVAQGIHLNTFSPVAAPDKLGYHMCCTHPL